MLLTDCYCYYTLPNIKKASLIFIFERFSPTRKETTFRRRWLVSATSKGRFMNFWVTTVDLQLFDSGCLFELGDIKSLHPNDYNNCLAISWKPSLLAIDLPQFHQTSLQNQFSLIHAKPRFEFCSSEIILCFLLFLFFSLEGNAIWLCGFILSQKRWRCNSNLSFGFIFWYDLEDMIVSVRCCFLKVFFVLAGGLPLSKFKDQLHHFCIVTYVPE